MKRKICVLTGTRAEYGLLRWLMDTLRDKHALEEQWASGNAPWKG